MENLLISCLFTNCAALTKEFLSQEKTSTEEGGGTLDFFSLLNGKMGSSTTDGMAGSGVTVVPGGIDETASKDQTGETPKENEKKEQETPSLSTQNIFALLQTCFSMNSPQEANIQENIEKFLKGIFSLLEEGESVEFVKEKGNIDLFSLMKSDEKESVGISEDKSDESQSKPEKISLIGYLAAMLQQANNIEKTDGENTGPEVKNSSENGADNTDGKINKAVNNENSNAEKHTALTDKDAFTAFKKQEIIPDLNNEVRQNDGAMKSIQKIEVKKIDSQENVFQIIAHESKTAEDDELNKNTSVLTIKTEKTVSFQDDDAPKVVSKISDKEIDNNAGKDERQLLSQNDFTKMNAHMDKETAKAVEKTSFASMMADRIEKIAEQYANKSVSTDMVIRLKIDDKESILVGFKDQGQKISVEVKTTNEGMGNFLQSQKEEIAKQLEGKFVYANIHVDVQNENSQKREQKEQQKKHAQEENQKDFGVFLETLA